MKCISKASHPKELVDYLSMGNCSFTPTYDGLSRTQKDALNSSIVKEQGGICCYCGCKLVDNDSHIEHFKPQTTFPQDALDYKNLHVSCQRDPPAGKQRCGNAKGGWFDDELMISPLDSACEEAFSFDAEGGIRASNSGGAAASETISRLRLDSPDLCDLRSGAIAPFTEGGLSGDELRTFVQGYLQRTGEGRFRPFWATIRHIFLSE